MPILPMVLVNGAEGIGTGWSTKIPNYDVREIVNNLRRMLDGQQPTVMVRWLFLYKNRCFIILVLIDFCDQELILYCYSSCCSCY